ncbi:MAG TPA: RNA 2',3'-cyclic phosphodiesterase [Sphingomicrobium sp.]
MHRLFVAIRPPEEVCDRLVDVMDDSPALRWVPFDNLHLTLRFIGEVERPMAEDIARALQGIRAAPFAIRLQSVGRFDQRGGGAIWAGVEPREPVASLAAKVDRACVSAGLEPEHRAFHPHITLARFRRSAEPEATDFVRRQAGLSSAPFPVGAFTLFESRLSRHGAHYEPIADYPLSVPLG